MYKHEFNDSGFMYLDIHMFSDNTHTSKQCNRLNKSELVCQSLELKCVLFA